MGKTEKIIYVAAAAAILGLGGLWSRRTPFVAPASTKASVTDPGVQTKPKSERAANSASAPAERSALPNPVAVVPVGSAPKPAQKSAGPEIWQQPPPAENAKRPPQNLHGEIPKATLEKVTETQKNLSDAFANERAARSLLASLGDGCTRSEREIDIPKGSIMPARMQDQIKANPGMVKLGCVNLANQLAQRFPSLRKEADSVIAILGK